MSNLSENLSKNQLWYLIAWLVALYLVLSAPIVWSIVSKTSSAVGLGQTSVGNCLNGWGIAVHAVAFLVLVVLIAHYAPLG